MFFWGSLHLPGASHCPLPAAPTLLCSTCNVRALRTYPGPHASCHSQTTLSSTLMFPAHTWKLPSRRGCFIVCIRSQHTSPVKDQLENVFDLAGHMVSVTFTQLCLCSMESCHRKCTDNTYMDGRPKKVIYQNRCHSKIWPKDYSSLLSGLYDTHSWTCNRHVDIKKVKYFTLSW